MKLSDCCSVWAAMLVCIVCLKGEKVFLAGGGEGQ